jgi:hypothetical protein
MQSVRLIWLFVLLGAVGVARAGDLRVTCPPGLEILVDGAPAGVCDTTENGKVLRDLDNGLHTLRFEKSGFLPAEYSAVVGPTTRQVAIGMLLPRTTPDDGGDTTPAEAAAPVGSIEVTSEPMDCTIKIEDVWAAKKESLLTIPGVPAGEHVLWAERFGEILKTDVFVSPGEPLRVNADFIRKRIEIATAATDESGGADADDEQGPAGEPECIAYWVEVLRTGDFDTIETTQKQLDEVGFPPRDQKLITIEDDGVLPLYKLRIGPLVDRWTAKLVIHRIRPLNILGTRILTEPCEQDFKSLKRAQ